MSINRVFKKGCNSFLITFIQKFKKYVENFPRSMYIML